jgi:undecaprenyl-diphosphatase
MSQRSSELTPPAARRAVSPLPLLCGAAAVLGLGLALSGGAAHTWWQVVTLGVVEGVTEFLPISSTGHLLLAGRLLGFKESMGGTFEIFIQFGAVLAVIGYYARDLLRRVADLPRSAAARRFWLNVVLACIPASAVGFLLRKWIKAHVFASPSMIAATLIVGGLAMIAVELLWRRPPTTTDPDQIRPAQALGVGAAQVLALLPGMSRSATAMIGGMLGGMDRSTATNFSFYLAIPILGGATVADLLGSLDQVGADDIGRLAVGTLVAFVVAWLSISWLLRYVARNSLVPFGIYRIAVGLLALALAAAGLL